MSMKNTSSQPDKKMIYSIRSLKNGTGSVLIGASFILLALTAPSVSAAETSLGTQENVSAISSGPATTETSQAEEKTPILVPKDANASLESKTSEPVAVSETATTETSASLPNNKDEKTEVSSLATEKASPADTVSETPIADNYFRIHVKKLPQENQDSQGLWTWDDVEKPSENWPNGAQSFKDAKKDDYGYYLDVKLKNEQAKKISFLINNTKGDNLTGDRSVERLSPKMNEAWLDENYKVHNYQPQPAGTIRVNHYRTDGNYDKKSLWYWGDVKNPSSGEWPDGTDFTASGKHGRYIDIPLNEAAREFGFLLLDESK